MAEPRQPRSNTSPPGIWRTAAAVFWKDLALELRRRQLLAGLLVFSILILFIFHFAMDLQIQVRAELTSGILWASVIFSGALGFQYTTAVEQQSGGMDGLRLAPIRASWVFLGKFLANLFFLLLAELLLLPVCSVLFSSNLFQPLLLLILLLGTIGYGAAGTLVASMSARISTRELMLPLLLLPLAVPLLIPAVQASSAVLQGETLNTVNGWMNMLIGYDILLLTVASLLYEPVIEE